jgi:imidazoleglycerol-phosphate dehydratase / histidinol-phosphatase
MLDKFLFLDRDGTLIVEPPDGRIDALEKLQLMPDVIPALLRLKTAGYRFVVVSNQEGLGRPDFTEAAFAEVERHVQALFGSQGIEFDRVLLCPHGANDECVCRKPKIGLLHDFAASQTWDRAQSGVVGDRDTDMELARNLGVKGYRVRLDGTAAETWSHVAHLLIDRPRISIVERKTRETQVRVEVDLDARDEPVIKTGLGFFDHMLEQLGKHGGFRLVVTCDGDLEVDEHHTVEDVALALGQALRAALGDKRGIERYGFLLPMDETAAEVAIDLGGRPFLVFAADFKRDRVGDLPTELVEHFFRSLAETLGAAIHIKVTGENTHHMVESSFKGVARTLRRAIARDGYDLPTTKGTL